jgi:hypothetical protein
VTALPDARHLTRAQYAGWACVWCGRPLTTGATLAGRAVGSIGAHRLDVDVYQCPDCTPVQPQERTRDHQP